MSGSVWLGESISTIPESITELLSVEITLSIGTVLTSDPSITVLSEIVLSGDLSIDTSSEFSVLVDIFHNFDVC